jgi:hypothetical protein
VVTSVGTVAGASRVDDDGACCSGGWLRWPKTKGPSRCGARLSIEVTTAACLPRRIKVKAAEKKAPAGFIFAALCSAIYGYSEGDAAVRDWRNNDDSNFVWWSFDGQRHEAPITYFQVLDHVRLERVEMCELIDSDGTSLSRPVPSASFPVRVTEPRRLESPCGRCGKRRKNTTHPVLLLP